jgi:hypothetical protein
MTRHRLALLVAVMLASLAVAATAEPPADYVRLNLYRYSSTPESLAAEVAWAQDTATWTLSSGRMWVQEPIADGTLTGFVFEGEGRFVMEIPDPYELAQLRRFSNNPELERIDYRFTKLVVRGSHLADLGLELTPPNAPRPLDLPRNRHDFWLRQYLLDANARTLVALRNPQAEYLRLAMLTDKDDWVVWEFDSDRLEEIRVDTYANRHDQVERWISLDRPEERRPSGRPSPTEDWPLDLVHVDVSAVIGGLGKSVGGGAGRSGTQSHKTHFDADVQFEAAQELGAVRLYLHPFAHVERVIDGSGRELEFARDRIGNRATALDNRLHDPELAVFLAEPVGPGGTLDLHVEYEMEIANFVSGISWYPSFTSHDAGLVDFHTARISVTAPKKITVRAMGNKEIQTSDGGTTTTVYRVSRPAKMVTFTTAENILEERLTVEGLPEVMVFSSAWGMDENMLHDTGADLVSSINYFQQLFGSPLQVDRLDASMIAAGHGQAFEGLLHLSDSTGVEFSDTVPMFRAHEVAHQWWGHQVGWKTYRDQWLSEGFAEYSAMLYMQASLENGKKLFQEALQVSCDELTGSLGSSFSRFSRPGQTLLNSRAVDRVGPIGHGHRAGVGESPGAYSSLAYNKGAYVLHMLRVILQIVTKSDETFFAILNDWIITYGGKAASTEDFEAMVAKHAPADWSWFFDEWVYRAEIPTYQWDYRVGGKNSEGKVEVTLDVRQSNVPPDFKMLVPVRLDFGGGKGGDVLVMVDQPHKEITMALPARPRKLEFNPDHAILAKVKKR